VTIVRNGERQDELERERRPGRRPPRRSGALAAALLAVVVLVALVVWLALDRSVGGDGTAAQPIATTTAEIVRRDLIDTQSFPGALGYADRRAIVSLRAGTLTAVAAEGSAVGRGETLYRIDDRPVVLMYGPVPAYRALSEGVPDGRDVRELERNLVELGYDPDGGIVVDREFTAATRDAVERWQDDVGVPAEGVVGLGDVVFLEGPQRVGRSRLEIGSPLAPGAAVMEVASTEQVVTVDLPADRQTLVSAGDTVVVELPDGTRIAATVETVGTVAEAETLPDGSVGEATIPLTIRLEQPAPTNLDQAPVTVEVTTEAHRDVLAVPLTALLALEGGGYAVEVEEVEGSRLVAVEPGLFADGYVEIEGDVREGMEVVVPE
jgi:peptidoglycan hydrolase-like protein with peptidoglycan-binding domain